MWILSNTPPPALPVTNEWSEGVPKGNLVMIWGCNVSTYMVYTPVVLAGGFFDGFSNCAVLEQAWGYSS